MGLFGRKKDEQGLYTGDAPVSAPGYDGAAPGAYTGGQFRDPNAGAPPQATVAAPSSYSTPPSGVGQSYTAPPQGSTPNAPGPSSPQEAFQNLPPRIQQALGEFLPPQGGQGARVVAGQGLDLATAARVQQQLSQAGRKVSKLGCLIIAIPIVGALVAAGIGVFAAVKGSTAAQDAISGIVSAQGGSAVTVTVAGTAEVGQPVSITTADADYRLTVYGAEIQQGDGWGYDGPNAAPSLIVGAEIARTDAGQEPVEFTAWNWSVTGDDGTAVTGDIISHFAPSLDGPELAGGESMRGFVSFATSVTDVTLTVAASPFGTPLATWHLTATTPKLVAGEIGTPAQGEISRPGFTVTAGQPEIVTADDERVNARPTSGQYLVVPVTFTGIEYMEGSIGNVDSRRLVFVSADAKKTDPPLESTFAGVPGADSFYAVSADAPTSGVLAFDTASVKGELQLRGEADQPIITWSIDAS